MICVYFYRDHIVEPDPCNKHVIAYYKFDRSYRDVCFGHNAINEGSNRRHPSTGISNAAAQFGNQYSKKLSIPSLNAYTWGSKFSVSFWFKTESSYRYGKKITILISNGRVHQTVDHMGSWEIYITMLKKGDDVIGASVVTSRGAKTWTKITTATVYHWHHVVMTYDGITMNFYHNSHLKLTDSKCCYGDIVSRNNDVVIGHKEDNRHTRNYEGYDDVEDFEGYIDETKLFKKTLTAREVLKLYQLKVV